MSTTLPAAVRFCSDRRNGDGTRLRRPRIWHAVGGTITIELSPLRSGGLPGLRRASVTLSNLVLRSTEGKTVRVAGPVKLTAIVGSVAGDELNARLAPRP